MVAGALGFLCGMVFAVIVLGLCRAVDRPRSHPRRYNPRHL